MAYTEEQIDHIISLEKQLERQRIERQEQELEEAVKVLYKTKEVAATNRKLKEQRRDLEELRYNMDPKNKDPPIDLGNGKIKITLWKALPKELERE
jgi:hypothetical protein